jgi:hypothetical protein
MNQKNCEPGHGSRHNLFEIQAGPYARCRCGIGWLRLPFLISIILLFQMEYSSEMSEMYFKPALEQEVSLPVFFVLKAYGISRTSPRKARFT